VADGVRLAATVAASLAAIVGPDHVLADPAERAGFEVDWTRRFQGEALAVVRPATTGEVAAVAAACQAAGVPMIPQGGNTGLVGGAVPAPGSVVVSLRRLAAIDAVDAVAGQLTAGAGATIAAVARRAEEAGWAFGVDFAARDAATVGGAIATNAGGTRVVRYGPMAAQLVGFEAVLADGRVIRRLPGQVKEVAGYDLARLLAGSEGTLAIITRARLRLVLPAAARTLAWIAVGGLAEAVALATRLRRNVAGLEAVELVGVEALHLAVARRGVAPPVADAGPAVLVEAVGDDSSTGSTGSLGAALSGAPEVVDAVVVADESGRRRLWAIRDSISEAVAAEGVPHKLDVVVPHRRLADFGERVGPMARGIVPGARVVTWGHLAEGNLHVNVLGLAPDDERVDDAILRLVLELGGSISAEHGIGRAKARWLPLARDPADVATMRAIKGALDPGWLLNPGVLFERPG
jgi:FAD/FMN-containing dehydrogenase